MQAKEKPFSFISLQQFIEIPFFQRSYVWQESNWEELLDSLLDKNNSHFLGSIIMKALKPQAGEISRYSLIDGQQRLTTLSILTKACYERLLKIDGLDAETLQSIKSNARNHLFCKVQTMPVKYNIKIRHSSVDKKYYEAVINDGSDGVKVDFEQIIFDKEVTDKPASNRIMQCYKYFSIRLGQLSDEEASRVWEILVEGTINLLVCITLDADENEQAIFDVVNSAGVRLTCADTIKNSLFQKLMENAINETEKNEVIQFYSDDWESVFSGDNETITFWSKERHLGRITRDNIEILLHCVAVIKQFYNPEIDKMSDLSQRYKDYIRNLSSKDIRGLISEIKRYAQLYKQYFIAIDSITPLSYEDYKSRLFHILSECDITTFYPYILKILNDSMINGCINDNELKPRFQELEIYVLRHIICGASTKNFNKECMLLVNGSKTMLELFQDKRDLISDDIVRNKLQNITSNRNAALILFWIELYQRAIDKSDLKIFNYNYSLEHILPQKWQKDWSVEVLPVKDESGQIVTDTDKACEIRNQAVYEIGNMTLLNSKLNASLSNCVFDVKVNGQLNKNGSVKKRGYKQLADFQLTREIVDLSDQGRIWDEIEINNRTEKIIRKFLEIWRITK